jgi:hypothetical protein
MPTSQRRGVHEQVRAGRYHGLTGLRGRPHLPARAAGGVFGTEALSPAQLAIVVPFPFIVWGADEIRRLLLRRYHASRRASPAQ